ncbi:hypothetical protein RFI_36508 [Reticulomyxa filosa]|uniref:Uncharacterized protein n=1 Tax=Reticulomyxa filosa TaxID=46433 RepID=X6LIH3_RETFI|nr:hypothetical protein RFI_36508 [Reticulomyxa filosa]|eukprot:ETO00932.1 hypothetical protein RFI_36508 [Reticulomyxa filosa]
MVCSTTKTILKKWMDIMNMWKMIASAIDMKRESEMSEYTGVFEMHQGEITEEEVIEATRHISSHKTQGPDNIHNQMIKNGGQSMIDSLVLFFGRWQTLFQFQNQIEITAFARITDPLHCFLGLGN